MKSPAPAHASNALEVASVSESLATASFPARLARMALAGYGRFISPALPRVCRFHPTCSVYADQAIERYGLLRGLRLTIVRLSKCHPFHPGGYDPVR